MPYSRYYARRPTTGGIRTSTLVALGLINPLTGITTMTGEEAGERYDENYDDTKQTTMGITYHGEDKCEIPGPRDNRPEWQKIGSRGGRSRPNRKGK